jgi:general secretion pathway protein D
MTLATLSRNFDLTGFITALSQCKDSRLLADPNVVVVDNEPATISIVSEIPYQQLTQTGQGGNIGTTAFREAGVKLTVTPRISDDGTILMVVEPEFSRLTGFTPEQNQPIIDRRTAKTHVRVNNGHTFVLGGLRQRTELTDRNGIPGLMKIPYIGWLFRSRRIEVRESELIVFVKPELVTTDELPNQRQAVALDYQQRALDSMKSAGCGYPVPSLPQENGTVNEVAPLRSENVPSRETVPPPPAADQGARPQHAVPSGPSQPQQPAAPANGDPLTGPRPLPPITDAVVHRLPAVDGTVNVQAAAYGPIAPSSTQPAAAPKRPLLPAAAAPPRAAPATTPTKTSQPASPRPEPTANKSWINKLFSY